VSLASSVGGSLDHMMPTYKRWPVELTQGRGARLYDSEGRAYLDLFAGIAVANVGHSHPAVVAAITSQAARLIHVSNLYRTGPQERLAHRLAELTGGKLSFFTNSGAESIECALKLTRKWALKSRDAGKTRVIATEGGFHGRTCGALAATGQPTKQEPFAPMLSGFTHVEFADGDALDAAMGHDVAGVLVEPVQGEAGVRVPPDGYLAIVRSLCDEWGALMIVDEVQTGLGRTGRWFGYEHDLVTPDVVCLAKALAGGLPMGACLATPQVADVFAPGDHATTFGGGPVQSAAACAVLDVIEAERLVERAEVAGARLMDGLTGIFGDAGKVRGRGLLIGVEFERPIAHQIVEAALDKGVLVNDPTPNVLRCAPPLVITDSEIDAALKILEEVWIESGTA
jgi:acetylornithine/N-succinyldiaminopimelate aminotransferase